jgi:hypothetical protein
MKPEFYEAYRDLADLYRIAQRYPYSSLRYPFRLLTRSRDIKIVNDALENAIRDTGVERKLRPDARLFLLVNVHNMVVLPLSFAGEMPPQRVTIEMLSEDLRLILKDASARAEQLQEEEISGHMVLNVLSEVWGKLRITEWQLWG